MPIYNFDKEIALLEYLELMGCHIIDSVKGIINCEKKFIQLSILKKANLPIIETICGTNMAFNNVIYHPNIDEECVVKSVRGCEGKNVFLSPSKSFLKSIDGSLNHTYPYLFQEYIKYSHGKSLRVEIINNKHYRTSMLKSRNDEFQSNTGFGGKWKDISGKYPEAEKLALEATKCMGLDIAGVDLLFKEDGSFVICEVNQNPDLYCNDEKEDTKTVKISTNSSNPVSQFFT